MPVEHIERDSPVILALPYTGTNMQRAIVKRLRDESHAITESDRYLDRFMSEVMKTGSSIRANFHRFLSDADYLRSDRAPTAGRHMLGVVPLLDRTAQPVWRLPPTAKEAETWRAMWYAPYHAALAAQIAQTRSKNGFAVIVTCRARRSDLPQTANSGQPDLRVSTYRGTSCDIQLAAELTRHLGKSDKVSANLDVKSDVGWTTRHYGRPDSRVHTLTLEVNEGLYLHKSSDEDLYNEERARDAQREIKDAFGFLQDWRPN